MAMIKHTAGIVYGKLIEWVADEVQFLLDHLCLGTLCPFVELSHSYLWTITFLRGLDNFLGNDIFYHL